ncbi:MAG: VCBS repeat-containing protein [Candidatus Aminicenantes bacterium]|nr:MAG: VCBS repeat-containing protein [Candidatus Aminicenantes bacterium]
MKVLKKIKTFHILIILICGISLVGKGYSLYGDDYVKVWDSGNIIPNPVWTAVVGDQDRDGKKEIIVSDFSRSYNAKIYILENAGDNSYQLVWHSGDILTGNDNYWDKAVGDLDKDGKGEIIAGGEDGLIGVFENAGDNSYQLAWASPLMPYFINYVFIGDQDNDGQREIIAACDDEFHYGIVYVFENTGDDTYEIVWNSGDILGERVGQAIPADADGDGKGDIIVPCFDGKVYVFENPGPAVISVEIDIKPGSWPNAINPLSKGVIPVAILTTSTAIGESVDFDAISVDPLSITFGPDNATEVHGKGHVEDIDNDGDLDMVLHFKTQETGIQYGDTTACLTGKTFDGKSIQACDAIKTVNKEKK